LLGRLGQTTCIIEVYRNAVSKNQIKDCVNKLLTLHRNQLRSEKKEGNTDSELPFLWILTPTISEEILAQSKADPEENWEKGVYFVAEIFSTGIVAIHQKKWVETPCF
jgi:hypothetical protein